MMPETADFALREPRTPLVAATRWVHDHRRAVEFGAALALFVGLSAIRTWRISETFWLLGEQIRDWTIALGSWRDLPLSGTPSTAGGRSLGPIYYWTLWAIRHVVGPWCANLPHAGGIGLSLIQSAADAVLLVALWRRLGSFLLAMSIVLLAATQPYDLSLTATIWNPPLAVALVKVAIACVLLDPPRRAAWHVARVTIVAWLAVQAHSSALFVTAPLLVMIVVEEAGALRARNAWSFARLMVELVAVLELPFLADRLMHPAGPIGPTGLVAGVAHAAVHPSEFHVGKGVAAMLSAFQFDLIAPWRPPERWFAAAVALIFVVGAAALASRRDLRLTTIALLPLLAALAGYSTIDRPFEAYWVLVLAPSLLIVFAVAITGLRPRRLAHVAVLALVVVTVVVQPARWEMSHGLIRIAEYGPLQRGSRQLRAQTAEIAALDTTFPLPPSTDPTFLYRVLGGRITPTAAYRATIDRSGRVAYQPAAR